jgi:pimeloyl-ACP methyl ester carboxylesterase
MATLGTKFFWDADIAARETALLDPHQIAAKVPHYARVLADRHEAAGWETVLEETSGLLWSLAEHGGFARDNLARIEQRVRIMVGDRDSTVSIAECVEVYRALPQGELEVLPGTPHPLERISHDRLARSLIEFFRNP